MTQSELQEFIQQYVRDKVKEDVSPDLDLFANNILDSFDFISIINALDDTFNISVDLSELNWSDILTINSMAAVFFRLASS